VCGIAGIYLKNAQQRPDEQLVRLMSNTLSHRGPDDSGLYVADQIGLAHRRLSIIDLAGGHQPIFNEDNTVCIVFNGEIYNHESLRAKLVAKGHVYRTRSDTETILHGYEEFGEDVVTHLRGMFAFAIYDARKKQLFLARDRVGEKPIYYFTNGSVFMFASEIKALLASKMIEKRVHVEMLDSFLSVGYVPGEATLFENVFKLPPAHSMTVDEDLQVLKREYWDIRGIRRQDIPFDEACRVFTEKLEECVRIRLMSEVPLGVFLSGGLDSTSIVALMSRMSKDPIKTYAVGYRDQPRDNELNFARLAADTYKTEHHEFYLTPDDLFDSMNSFLEHCEEPLTESAGIALFRLSQLAKKTATVVLSGEGADELLSGYPLYAKMRRLEALHRLARALPAALWKSLAMRREIPEKTAKYLDWISSPFNSRFRSISYDLSESIKARMYTDSFRTSLAGAFEKYFDQLHDRAKDCSLLQKMLYIDTKSWLPDDILIKSDRMTMGAAVELRAPFLDHELFEYCTALPDRYKLRNNRGKYVLREVMKPLIPRQILNRGKKGFTVPLTAWFGKELLSRAQSLLSSPESLGRGYFQRDYIHGLFERIARGEDLGRRIYSLLILELWHRKYID
jgi:asparagine synthase (glutamine-hydrolysing)